VGMMTYFHDKKKVSAFKPIKRRRMVGAFKIAVQILKHTFQVKS
jgi:hypothetical protein